jgi:hypothetical protein
MLENIYLLIFIVLTIMYIYIFYSKKIKFRLIYALVYLIVFVVFFRIYMN